MFHLTPALWISNNLVKLHILYSLCFYFLQIFHNILSYGYQIYLVCSGWCRIIYMPHFNQLEGCQIFIQLSLACYSLGFLNEPWHNLWLSCKHKTIRLVIPVSMTSILKIDWSKSPFVIVFHSRSDMNSIVNIKLDNQTCGLTVMTFNGCQNTTLTSQLLQVWHYLVD